MHRNSSSGHRWHLFLAPAIARAALVSAILALGQGSALAGEPGDVATKEPLCCGVPPRDEVTADLVMGRWIVTHAGIALPLRSGERIEFRRDGTMATGNGACRFAILRTELTVTCAGGSQTGEVRFVDDTKLMWRLDGKDTMFIAPGD